MIYKWLNHLDDSVHFETLNGDRAEAVGDTCRYHRKSSCSFFSEASWERKFQTHTQVIQTNCRREIHLKGHNTELLLNPGTTMFVSRAAAVMNVNISSHMNVFWISSNYSRCHVNTSVPQWRPKCNPLLSLRFSVTNVVQVFMSPTRLEINVCKTIKDFQSKFNLFFGGAWKPTITYEWVSSMNSRRNKTVTQISIKME